MKGLIVILVSSLTGALGWWLGALVGTWTAYALGVVATAIGVYVAKRLCDEYLP
jgi:hypothetical protein